MADLLDAVRAEIRERDGRLEQLRADVADHERALEVLRRMEDDAQKLEGGGMPTDPPRPTAPKREGRKRAIPGSTPTPRSERAARAPAAAALPGARDSEAKVISAILRSNQPLSADQIAEQVGAPKGSVRKTLQRLVTSGQIVAEGATKARRYRKTPREGFHTEARARTEAGREANAGVEATAIEKVAIRVRVMRAIAGDQNALTQDHLAEALDVAPELVTEACSVLLERRQIIANPDGTYRRDAAREAAA